MMLPAHHDHQRLAGIGLDIGGTKLAGVVIDPSGSVVARTRRRHPAATVRPWSTGVHRRRRASCSASPGPAGSAVGTDRDRDPGHDRHPCRRRRRLAGARHARRADGRDRPARPRASGDGAPRRQGGRVRRARRWSRHRPGGRRLPQPRHRCLDRLRLRLEGAPGEHRDRRRDRPRRRGTGRACRATVVAAAASRPSPPDRPSPAPPARPTAGWRRSPRRRANGDRRAIAAFDAAAEHLGRVLADFVMVMDVGMLMVGGGVSAVGAPLLDPLQAVLDRYLGDVVESVTVVSRRARRRLGGDRRGALVAAGPQRPGVRTHGDARGGAGADRRNRSAPDSSRRRMPLPTQPTAGVRVVDDRRPGAGEGRTTRRPGRGAGNR